MVLYILFAVATVFIATKVKAANQVNENNKFLLADQKGINAVCISSLFLMLFLLSALRINTGGDYKNYIRIFHDIIHGNYVVTEVGFNYTVTAVYSFFGCENYLAVFALFAGVMIAFFLWGMYKQSKDFAMTFFMYITLSLYFQSFSTVRYYFALSIVFVSIYYFGRKRYISGIILVLLASLFHKSVLLTIPVYVLAGFNWKKIHVVIVTILALTGFVFKQQYLMIMLKLYPSYVTSGEYIGAGGISYVNVFRCFAVLVISLVFYEDVVKNNKENRFYFYLNYAALLIFTCFSFIPYGSRIGYYMNISHILYVPSIIKCIKDKRKANIIKWCVIVLCVVYFIAFLYQASGEELKILPYNTWLFEDYEFMPLSDRVG